MTKIFGPVVALDGVDLSVLPGEVHGLIGENGSGKSTISSIFSGLQAADSGEMLFLGREWHPATMQEALSRGVGMLLQENGTVPGITVAENLFLCRSRAFGAFRGREGRRWGPIHRRALYRAAKEALHDIGADHISPEAITGELDMMDRKLIEIAKVWLQKPRLLVVDETTTALSQTGREILYGLVRRLRDNGGAVVFISHDLEEITERCDRLTVLRDGRIIRVFSREEFEENAIRTAMIGRELEGDYYRSDYGEKPSPEVVLEAKGITLGERLRGIDLQLHRGELLGIGGLSACGMHLFGKVLFGALRPERGEVLTGDRPIRSPAEAMAAGIGYAAKDRDLESLCLSASVGENIAIAGLDRMARGGSFILPGTERKYVQEQIDFMRVKCASPDQPVSQLSGGNKQKVVFGKWIGAGADILILDCPTRGIDIGVKQTMYRLMYQMKSEGKSIVMISEELTELIGMSDRLIMMKDGQISGEFSRRPGLSDADLIEYMI